MRKIKHQMMFNLVATMKSKHAFDCGTANSQVDTDGRDKDLESEHSPRKVSLVEMCDRGTRLRLRLATPKPKPKLLIKDKQQHFNPHVTIWDALVVGVGFIQLIGSYAAYHSNNAPLAGGGGGGGGGGVRGDGSVKKWGTVAAAAQQRKGLLPYFWKHWKVIFHLLRIFGPLVYLRNSAEDFKCEMIVGEKNYDDDDKYARRTKNTNHMEQDVVTTATRQKQRQKQRQKRSPLSGFNFLCCRRELVVAATVCSAALLNVVSAICKLLLLSSDGNMVLEKTYFSDCAAALESASVHMYLVSAIFTLWKSPDSWIGPWSFTNGTPQYSSVGSIEAFGDAFFGAASVVDVCLQHSSIPEGIHCWCVVSAFLWTCSSWFYVLAKCQR
jgi:hypothetical protein